MKTYIKKYTPEDYLRIREFLVSSFERFDRPYNWTIDFWNFCRYFGLILHSFDISQWEETIRIWEGENGDIVGDVHSNGIKDNEVYFQVGSPIMDINILEEMFEYAEGHLSILKDGKRVIHLWIPDGDQQRESIASDRGYTKQWNEITSVISLEKIPDTNTPKGFVIKNGNELSDEEKGIAFAKAFRSLDNDFPKILTSAYGLLRQASDYQPDLDLCIVSDHGEIASFCTAWYEPLNCIGMLEPVGTVPEYRRMGLGRTVVYEALKRLAGKGAKKVYVGSDQEFYLAIGFKRDFCSNMWIKIL